MRRISERRWRRAGPALAGALLLHAGLAWWIGARLGGRAGVTLALAPVSVAPSGAAGDLAAVELVELIAVPAGPPLEAMLGPGDVARSTGAHPAPASDVDLPGRAAARTGGGAAGGSESWTGRQDEHDLQSQIWNHPDRNRLPRVDTGERARSPEALVRAPEAGFADRTERRARAQAGEAQGRDGADEGGAAGAGEEVARAWDDADPWFDAAARRAEQRRAGTTATARSEALLDRGVAATDAHAKGPAADDHQTASASDALRPLPFEMTRNRAGGPSGGEGVAGNRAGDGVSARSRARRGDTAGTSAAVPVGAGGVAVRAARDQPYFRRMYQRIDGVIVYPRALAVRLEQGEVVVRFRLDRDGRVTDLALERSSGFEAFDQAVLGAVRQAGPFGPVPEAVLSGHPSILVRAPYVFRNPLIR